jgi:hypothetical protein
MNICSSFFHSEKSPNGDPKIHHATSMQEKKKLPKTTAPKYNVTMSPHFCHIPLPLNFKTLNGFLPPKFHFTIPCHLPYSTPPYHVAIVILLLLLS